MADYGIFGKGSSGNSWFANKLDDFHASTKKYDPLGHYSVEGPMKGSHWLVEKSSGALADAGIGEGFNTRLNQEADENGDNFGLGSQRLGLGVLSVLGAMYGYGAAGAGEAGAAGGAGAGEAGAAGGGAFGASGIPWEAGVDAGGGAFGASGIPWGGGVDSGGTGLGANWSPAAGSGYEFNPGAADSFSMASDFPTQGMKGMNGGMFGQGKSQGMGMFGGGSQQPTPRRQNLPLMENEKTDQQKLAELLQAMNQQQGGYA